MSHLSTIILTCDTTHHPCHSASRKFSVMTKWMLHLLSFLHPLQRGWCPYSKWPLPCVQRLAWHSGDPLGRGWAKSDHSHLLPNHCHIYFCLQEQCCVLARESTRPAKITLFTIWPFTGKIYQSLPSRSADARNFAFYTTMTKMRLASMTMIIITKQRTHQHFNITR